MICVLEITLFIFGIVCMVRGRIDLGRNIVGKPMVYLIGLVLMGGLVLPLAVGFALGAMAVAEGGPNVNAADVGKKYWWVELVCIGVVVLLALIMTFASQRPKTDDEYYTGGRRRRRRDDDDNRDYDRRRDDDFDDRDYGRRRRDEDGHDDRRRDEDDDYDDRRRDDRRRDDR